MIGACALALGLAVASHGAQDVPALLDAGRFAEAEAAARRSGDASDLVEVWFRAGLYDRILALPAEQVGRASSPLAFTHRRAAAALRVGTESVARAAVAELDQRVSVAAFATADERAAWAGEVATFREALDADLARRVALDASRVRARAVAVTLLLAPLVWLVWLLRR